MLCTSARLSSYTKVSRAELIHKGQQANCTYVLQLPSWNPSHSRVVGHARAGLTPMLKMHQKYHDNMLCRDAKQGDLADSAAVGPTSTASSKFWLRLPQLGAALPEASYLHQQVSYLYCILLTGSTAADMPLMTPHSVCSGRGVKGTHRIDVTVSIVQALSVLACSA